MNDRLAALQRQSAHEQDKRMQRVAEQAIQAMPRTIQDGIEPTFHQAEWLPAEVVCSQLQDSPGDVLVVGQAPRRRMHDLLGRSLAETLRLSHSGATLIVNSESRRLVRG